MALESKNFEVRNELADTMEFKGELKGLILDIAKTADPRKSKKYAEDAISRNSVTNEEALIVCVECDKINPNELNEKDRKTWDLIVNNRRGDTFEEMFNTDEEVRKNVRNLFERIA